MNKQWSHVITLQVVCSNCGKKLETAKTYSSDNVVLSVAPCECQKKESHNSEPMGGPGAGGIRCWMRAEDRRH